MPLPPEETGALAEALLGRQLAAGERSLLNDTTAGLPFFVIQVSLAADGEPSAEAPGVGKVLDDRLATAVSHGTRGRWPRGCRRARLHPRPAHGGERPRRGHRRERGRRALAAPDRARAAGGLRLHARPAAGCGLRQGDASAAVAHPPADRPGPRAVGRCHLDVVAAQLAEQYERGGRPDRARALPARGRDRGVGVREHRRGQALRAGARIVEGGPVTPKRDHEVLELLVTLAPPLNAAYGYSSKRLESVLERTISLAERLGRGRDPRQEPCGALGRQVRPGRTGP